MKPPSDSATGVLSWTCNKVEEFKSIVVPLVVQAGTFRSVATITCKEMSVAFGFFGAVNRRKPVLISTVTGSLVGTRGLSPRAYFSRLGMPSVVEIALSAPAPEFALLPNHCKRHA